MKPSECCRTNLHAYSEKGKWPLIRYLDTGDIAEGKISEIQALTPGKDKMPSRARRKVQAEYITYPTVAPAGGTMELLAKTPATFLRRLDLQL